MASRIKGFIVKKLFYHGYIGGKHTAIENLKKGLPGHFRGEVKPAIKELIQEEVLIIKSTGYGTHVSLNPHNKEKINHYIKS